MNDRLGAVSRKKRMRAFKDRVKAKIPRLYRLARTPYRFVKSRIPNALERRKRFLDAVQGPLLAQLDRTVTAGPFRGLRYVEAAVGSALCPKLLGTYERELHPWVEQLLEIEYDAILNVGCAEGYYAVGMAMRLKGRKATAIYAYDLDDEGRALAECMAAANGVGDVVQVKTLCDRTELLGFAHQRILILCDIEGAEFDLLVPDDELTFNNADLLVEVHDEPSQDTTRRALVERFEKTHTIEATRAQHRLASDTPVRGILRNPRRRRKALDEWRIYGTEWLLMTSRNPPGHSMK